MATALALPAELTIYTVAELRAAWRGWLGTSLAEADAGEALWADADAVDQVDAAGVQLLLALANTLARQGHRLQLHRPSGPLAQACQLLGVAPLLLGTTPEGAA
jgi:anti-anti-sigma regulatory factor